MTEPVSKNISDWENKVNFHTCHDVSYITYSDLNLFSGIFALTTLRCRLIDEISSSSPDDILPKVIPFMALASKTKPARLFAGRQTHSANIAVVDSSFSDSSKNDRVQIYVNTDSMITDAKDIALCVLTADCLPIFFYDRVKQVIGLVHAGRRGTEAGISAIAVGKMIESFNCEAKNIITLIGASIGPCCYDVDLWSKNRRQIENCGVLTIINPGICTGCHTDIFYSYRVEKGTNGRMLSAILLRR